MYFYKVKIGSKRRSAIITKRAFHKYDLDPENIYCPEIEGIHPNLEWSVLRKFYLPEGYDIEKHYLNRHNKDTLQGLAANVVFKKLADHIQKLEFILCKLWKGDGNDDLQRLKKSGTTYHFTISFNTGGPIHEFDLWEKLAAFANTEFRIFERSHLQRWKKLRKFHKDSEKEIEYYFNFEPVIKNQTFQHGLLVNHLQGHLSNHSLRFAVGIEPEHLLWKSYREDPELNTLQGLCRRSFTLAWVKRFWLRSYNSTFDVRPSFLYFKNWVYKHMRVGSGLLEILFKPKLLEKEYLVTKYQSADRLSWDEYCNTRAYWRSCIQSSIEYKYF